MLRSLRESRGWEVPRLAAELKAQAAAIGQSLPDRQSLIRMIYEWEAGTHRPRAYYLLFVLVYATKDELAARTIERGSELDRLMAALKAMGVSVNRRQFLLNAAALAGGVAGMPAVAASLEGQERLAWVLNHPRSVDLPAVAYLREQTLDLLRRNEAAASSTSLLPQASRQLEQITLLREHAPLGRVQQELCAVEAQSATLMARLAWDVSGQRDHATAARYYDQAITAAGNVREGWAEAFPRTFQRFLPVYTSDGDPKQGLYLAEQAAARAADGSSHVVAGWSSAFAAEAHALLGEERKARLLLDRADSHLSKITADDPMLGIFGREQLGGFVGACHLRLNDPDGAAAALQDSALRLGAGKEKHKSVILADLSTAFVLQGDPEHACAVLHQAIDLVELTGSAAGKRRAFAAVRQLTQTRWRNEPFVQDVQDRLLALAS
ncbi:MAG TPA: transcriptional regulator [Chloroflexota bacterium]|nr:transcriptional regulator [Chloroflexota bacterium]